MKAKKTLAKGYRCTPETETALEEACKTLRRMTGQKWSQNRVIDEAVRRFLTAFNAAAEKNFASSIDSDDKIPGDGVAATVIIHRYSPENETIHDEVEALLGDAAWRNGTVWLVEQLRFAQESRKRQKPMLLS